MGEENLKEKITEYIEEHKQEMLDDLMMLCGIDSVRDEAKPGMPYGEGAYKALKAAGRLCEKYGFMTKDYEGRVISADMNAHEACLDILAHMDVVAGGDGWTVTEPFKPVIRDGAVYGRGSSDDKGPAIAALYGMRAVSEMGIGLSKNCRLILGSNEESGSDDIGYYYKYEQEAPMTFSPDAEFPVINVEKGQLKGTVRWIKPAPSDEGGSAADEIGCNETAVDENAAGKAASNIRLVSCECGHTINIVPDKAYAVLTGINERELRNVCESVKRSIEADFGYDIRMISGDEPLQEGSGKASGNKLAELVSYTAGRISRNESAELRIYGKSAHASTPETGVNALTLMLNILSRLELADKREDEAVKKLAELFPFGDHRGRALSAESSDDVAGYTTVTADILRADSEGISLSFDSRTCLEAERTGIAARLEKLFKQAGFEYEYGFVPAHAVDGSSDFVQTLLACYEEVSGKKGRCVAVGGGTYVHELKNGVAFGAVGETTDTHMHGPDEFMLISELCDAAVIYALAIARLCA